MAQVENVADMQVGDHIVLPRAEWHLNHAGQAKFAEAQALMREHTGDGPSPQYQVQYTGKYDSTLERIR